MRSPILPPIRMNAADTSASSAIADWTPLTVVPRSSTTAEIETFISDVSTTSTNIAIASRIASLRSPAAASGATVAVCAVIGRRSYGRRSRTLGEPFDQEAVSEPPIADGERLPAELPDHGPHDAGSREDDLGPLGLQADELAAPIGAAGAVELDLAIDLGQL